MKRSKLQRIAALLLALALVAGLGACSQKDNSSGGSSSANTPSSSEESSEPSSSAVEEKTSGDDQEPLEITAVLTMFETPVDVNSEYWQDMQERCKVIYTPEWVPVTSYNDRLSLLVSTNDLPDIIRVENLSTPWVVKALEAGMFYDFTDSLGSDGLPNLSALNPAAWTNSKYKGRNYLIPNSRGQYNNCYFLRQDLLDKYDLPLPSFVLI